MSQRNILKAERMNSSETFDIRNNSVPILYTSTPKQKSDSAFSLADRKKTAQRRPILKKPMENLKITPRKRSLTMSDIRNKAHKNTRTPLKPLKMDSCSTTDCSPRSDVNHPAEEMWSIRKREILIRVFAGWYFYTWRNYHLKNEDLRKLVDHLELQKSLLQDVQVKESERREEITKIADQQKSEIIDLEERLLDQIEKFRNLDDFTRSVLKEYNWCLELFQKSSYDLESVCNDNVEILNKVIEEADAMEKYSADLNKLTTCAMELDHTVAHVIFKYDLMKKERNEALSSASKLSELTDILSEKHKIKIETEKYLKDTIQILRRKLEETSSENTQLKSDIKNMSLELEYTEHQIEEQKFQPKKWIDLARRAVRYSIYIFTQFRILSTF